MTRIVTVEQMRSIERAADASGWTYEDMMRRAGSSVADVGASLLGDPQGKRVLILVGSGNNGGDGLVAGCRLAERGARVDAWLIANRPSPDPHLEELVGLGGEIRPRTDDPSLDSLGGLVHRADLLIDAILGTGFRLPLREPVEKVLVRVGEALQLEGSRPQVLAVDCPSGVDCNTGEVAAAALRAHSTVTLAAVKPGLLRRPGADFVGRLVVGDIGLDPDMKELREVGMEFADADLVRQWLPARPSDAHKGTFGTVLIAGGSINYPGSVGLAGHGAYRVGAGLVCLAVPGSVQAGLVAAIPEAIWLILPQEMGVIDEPAGEILRKESARAQALLVGPGLGREDSTRKFLSRLLGQGEGHPKAHIGFVPSGETEESVNPVLPQLVVDADALHLLSRLDRWTSRLPKSTILTPHPGEMAALTGLDVATIQANREGVARERAGEWGHVVVLKGAHTVVAAPDGRGWVLPFATDALAKAGTGDVLAGAIAGLCAQGVGAVEASVLGAFLHGRAGELASLAVKASAGVLASEVAGFLPEAMAELASG